MSRPSWAQVQAAGAAVDLRDFAYRTGRTLPSSALDDRAALEEIRATADALVQLVTRDESWAPVVESFELVGRAAVWDAAERATR